MGLRWWGWPGEVMCGGAEVAVVWWWGGGCGGNDNDVMVMMMMVVASVMKSPPSNGVRGGEDLAMIGSEIGVGLPLSELSENPNTS
ncbi:hypothetical protein Tco_1520590 [Tanacetum coccineum]